MEESSPDHAFNLLALDLRFPSFLNCEKQYFMVYKLQCSTYVVIATLMERTVEIHMLTPSFALSLPRTTALNSGSVTNDGQPLRARLFHYFTASTFQGFVF